MQGPFRLQQDLHKIFSQGIAKDLGQDLHSRTPKPRRESHKLVIEGPVAGEDLRRSWYKNFPWASRKRAFTQAPLLHGICKNLLTRTCPRSCKDFLELEDLSRIFTRSSQKGLYKIMQGPLSGLLQNRKWASARGAADPLLKKAAKRQS